MAVGVLDGGGAVLRVYGGSEVGVDFVVLGVPDVVVVGFFVLAGAVVGIWAIVGSGVCLGSVGWTLWLVLVVGGRRRSVFIPQLGVVVVLPGCRTIGPPAIIVPWSTSIIDALNATGAVLHDADPGMKVCIRTSHSAVHGLCSSGSIEHTFDVFDGDGSGAET